MTNKLFVGTLNATNGGGDILPYKCIVRSPALSEPVEFTWFSKSEELSDWTMCNKAAKEANTRTLGSNLTGGDIKRGGSTVNWVWVEPKDIPPGERCGGKDDDVEHLEPGEYAATTINRPGEIECSNCHCRISETSTKCRECGVPIGEQGG